MNSTKNKNAEYPDNVGNAGTANPSPRTGTNAPGGSDLKGRGRETLPSTTREDIERADGEGMAPVPPPRPEPPQPREDKSSERS